MFYLYRTLILAAFVIATPLVGSSLKADEHCSHCGCDQQCQKVCRLVKTEKQITLTCWTCQSEDFCVPCPSCKGCKHREEGCQDERCKQCGIYQFGAPRDFVWFDWEPNGAKIRSRKKLMRKTIVKTVPSYKWVVEDLCQDCDKKTAAAVIQPGIAIPKLPTAGYDKLKYGTAPTTLVRFDSVVQVEKSRPATKPVPKKKSTTASAVSLKLPSWSSKMFRR